MILVLKRTVVAAAGFDTFAPWGVPRERWETWQDEASIDLDQLSEEKLESLEAVLTKHKNKRGFGVLLTDVQSWRAVLAEGVSKQTARTVRQFDTLLALFLLHVPGHRIYSRHAEGAMLAYYVTKVEYHPPQRSDRSTTPASVEMHLAYEEIGGRRSTSVRFYADDCLYRSVARALAQKGYQIESPELRKNYLEDIALYAPTSGAIGKQYWGRGLAYIESGDRYDRTSNAVNLDRWGEPSRVVIDLFKETDEKQSGSDRVYLHEFFWPNVGKYSHYDPENDELITPKAQRSRRTRRYMGNEEAPDEEETLSEADLVPIDENEAMPDKIEVPIHPWLMVFHLGKHRRMKAHVRQLTEYVYDRHLADKLVLPQDQKDLVKLLIETKGGVFQDLVQGKTGGAVILLAGPPGTGKTLTAEVYAESEGRALYSVQCSQLGTDPAKLEGELLRVFERARRWNAVMLLDEADVYVHERGSDIDQNAVVGVFLRVLEYQASVLFLTTNRPDDVDDAIASRCIARLRLGAPSKNDAAKIWQVLSRNAGIKIELDVIRDVVTANPGMTGRDIKNILKLASLMEGAKEDGITEEMIDFVKQFKPTGAD